MRLVALTALTLSALAGVANAELFNGDTTGGPTWTRTVAGTPPTGLSSVGTNVRYQAVTFSVDAAGAYDFLVLGVAPTNWDTYLHVYANTFDPTSQFVNVIAANDDFPSIGRSGFTGLNLAAGTYVAVVGGYDQAEFGSYSLEITGPGAVTFVPTPGAAGMLALAGVAVGRRRR